MSEDQPPDTIEFGRTLYARGIAQHEPEEIVIHLTPEEFAQHQRMLIMWRDCRTRKQRKAVERYFGDGKPSTFRFIRLKRCYDLHQDYLRRMR